MPGLPEEQQNKISMTSPSAVSPHTTIHIQLITDHDHDADSAIPQNEEAEDEYTLSAYGDISLGEVIVPPAPSSPRPGYSPLQSRFPQPHLRLKVRRPPMPKRRVGYTYIPDPLPYTGGIDLDKYWPGNPRPIANNSPWLYSQPMMPPPNPSVPVSQTQGKKLAKDGGSSLEKLVDELLPPLPSIRLSPPGSPSSQALSLPQETHEQHNDAQQGRLGHPQEVNDATKLPQSPLAPAPRKDKPKSAVWRTRLPPRLPIPKWDM